MAITHRSTQHLETIDEHRELCEAVHFVRRMLAGGRASRALIVQMVRDLSALLLEHFRHEEAEGYFAEALRAAPHLAERIDGLQNQHPQMMDLLASLIDGPISQSSFRQWWQRVDAGYSSFASLFFSHEAAETALLQEIYGEDLGDGD